MVGQENEGLGIMKGVTLSFGSSKQARSSVNVHGDEREQEREHLSEFKGDRIQRKEKRARVIPALPNASPYSSAAKKQKKGDVGKLSDKFEEAHQAEVTATTYGLVKREEHVTLQEKVRSEQAELSGLKADVDELPEAPESGAYASMPVEDFGKALLLGMGYTEATAVAPVEYIARPSRMGLGVKPDDIVTGKRTYKQLVDEEGNLKSVVREGTKLVDVATLGPKVGKMMFVAEGRHKGLKCVVREVDVDDEEGRTLVRLLPSEHDILLNSSMLRESNPSAQTQDASNRSKGKVTAPGSKASTDATALSQTEKSSRNQPPAATRQRRANGSKGDKQCMHSHPGTRGDAKHAPSSWLRENIRVRIIDKDVAKGRLYLKKGVVISVGQDGSCDVRIDDGGSVQEGLPQSQLETVVPKKSGTAVMFVHGKLSGRHARLLEKRAETVAVQLTESMDITKAHLDDVAEYVGDLEGEDY